MTARTAAAMLFLGVMALTACDRTDTAAPPPPTSSKPPAATTEAMAEKRYEVKHGMDKSPGHPEVKISVKKQESVYWYSTTLDFKVTKLTPQDPANCPPDPFYRKFPVDQPNPAREVSSGPARPEAADKECVYSVEFRDEKGNVIDPHIQIVR